MYNFYSRMDMYSKFILYMLENVPMFKVEISPETTCDMVKNKSCHQNK